MIRFRPRQLASGFTLIELLIVMVIIGLLASLVAPAMFGKVDSAKAKTAQAQMQLLATAIDTFRLDVGEFPANLDELRKSTKANWDGPYFSKDIPLDPWNNPYIYTVPGEDGAPYVLISYGQGGEPGGEDNAADIKY